VRSKTFPKRIHTKTRTRQTKARAKLFFKNRLTYFRHPHRHRFQPFSFLFCRHYTRFSESICPAKNPGAWKCMGCRLKSMEVHRRP
jgi:hypothetical protein